MRMRKGANLPITAWEWGIDVRGHKQEASRNDISGCKLHFGDSV